MKISNWRELEKFIKECDINKWELDKVCIDERDKLEFMIFRQKLEENEKQ